MFQCFRHQQMIFRHRKCACAKSLCLSVSLSFRPCVCVSFRTLTIAETELTKIRTMFITVEWQEIMLFKWFMKHTVSQMK